MNCSIKLMLSYNFLSSRQTMYLIVKVKSFYEDQNKYYLT